MQRRMFALALASKTQKKTKFHTKEMFFGFCRCYYMNYDTRMAKNLQEEKMTEKQTKRKTSAKRRAMEWHSRNDEY